MTSHAETKPLEPYLRAIRASDAAALCRIANMPGFRRGTLRLSFESVEYWEKRIASSGAENTWIVAELDGRLAGHGCLMARKPARMAHVGEIVMGVADDLVGRGIGSAILMLGLTPPSHIPTLPVVDLRRRTALRSSAKHPASVYIAS